MLTLRSFGSILRKKCAGKSNFFSIDSSSKIKNTIENKLNDSKTITKVWSRKQIPKTLAMTGARFETVELNKQPNPAPAIELIEKVPINYVNENIVACDGGGENLGHPKIYINLVST